MCIRFLYHGDDVITGFNFDIDLSVWDHKVIVEKDRFYIGILRPDGIRHSYHGVSRNGNAGTLLYVQGNPAGAYRKDSRCMTIADLTEQFIREKISFDDALQIVREKEIVYAPDATMQAMLSDARGRVLVVEPGIGFLEESGRFSLIANDSLLARKGTGGAAALGGAAGVSLGQMVINLTLGKKKYADVEEEMKELLEQLETLKAEFLHLADEDARVFAPLAAAYGLPGTTDEEKKRKAEVLEGHLLTASLVPLHVMEDAQKALDIMDILAEKGSRMAVSDVGVGVQFIRTALTGAVMNVWINTKSMKDREKAEELNRQADEMMRSGTAAADAVYQKVENALR